MVYIKNKRLLYFFTFTIVILFFTSCQSQRSSIKKPIKLFGPEYVLEQMHQNQSEFEWFSGKAKVDLVEGRKKSPFTAQLRIKRDSVIWISISSGVGIEGARILLTQDSVKYINRIEKTFFLGNYSFLSSLIGAEIDFDKVQALITAKDFSWCENQDLKVKVDNQLYQLESTQSHKLKKQSKLTNFEDPVYYQSIWINPETFKIDRIKIKELGKENKKILASYKQYRSVDGQKIPYAMDIEFDSEKGMSVEMVFYKVSLDEKVSFPFSISKKYSEIIL